MILEVILQSITITFTLLGVFFFIVGTAGIIRLPDFFSRTHPATKCDTLGAGSILIGLAILEKFSPEAIKLIVLAGFILMTSPTVGHALARSGYKTGLKPWTKKHQQEREVEKL